MGEGFRRIYELKSASRSSRGDLQPSQNGLMQPTHTNILKESFFGPWVHGPGKQGRVRHHYFSLAHWYESLKFMPTRPDLRDMVLLCPTIKEARKFSKARQEHWRSDWSLIRHQVLIAGLGFLTLDRPDLSMKRDMSLELVEQLADMKLPQRFIVGCIERFNLWHDGPRIGTFGSDRAPESVVGLKMAKTVQAAPSWTLVSLCNKKTCWKLHDWALSLYIPVLYVGDENSRLTNGLMTQMITASSQMVIFEERGGRASDVAIAKCKSLRTPVSLQLYRKDELGTESLI